MTNICEQKPVYNATVIPADLSDGNWMSKRG